MARKRTKRNQSFKVAIVGEGVTEWYYINDLKHIKNYKFAIKPQLPRNSNYQDIFKKAKELSSQGYDRVYCLIDLDDIIKSQQSINQYHTNRKSLIKNNNIKVIQTMPCIEYWFLLHFISYSTKIYSNCKDVESLLRNQNPLSNYEKSKKYFQSTRIYQTLVAKGNLESAIRNAKRLRKERNSYESPFSEIDILLNDLNNL